MSGLGRGGRAPLQRTPDPSGVSLNGYLYMDILNIYGYLYMDILDTYLYKWIFVYGYMDT